MVYCGKPSGGCHACRKRKTRCDKKPDGCTQCWRVKRVCPGYRDLGEVIFRNESDHVIRKAKAKEARAEVTSSASLFGISFPDRTDEEPLELIPQKSSSPLSCFSLATNIEDQATAYFVTNYVVNVGGPTRGHLDYLTRVYGDGEADTALLASMKAVGLAGVAHTRCAPSLLNSARYQYVKAIAATNAALKSPILVKKDSTLSSIMVLSIFETVTGCNQKSIQDWSEHLMGAAAVLKMRGVEQLNTAKGRHMFIQVTSSLMITCMQRGAPVPTHLVKWMEAVKSKIVAYEPAFTFQETMMKWTIFRASMVSGELTDPESILNRALEIDGIFISIFTTGLPEDWKYQTVYTDDEASYIYNGRYDVYYDHWISQIWNAMRSIRVMLHETIRDVLLTGFSTKPPRFTGSEYTSQFQRSTDICLEMQGGILASIPQHMGYILSSHSLISSDLLPKAPYEAIFPSVPMSGPYFLMWPLFYAGVMDITTEETRKFVANNLTAMGENMGIRLAVVLAKVVETKSGIRVW